MLLLSCAQFSLAQEQYRGLPYPPNEIFEAMLSYAEDGGFQGLTASLAYVRPLSEVLNREFKVDAEAGIRDAIAAKSPAEARKAVLRLIYLDLRLNIRTAGETEDAARREEAVQLAFLDYGFLSREIKAKDRLLDQEIKRCFRKLYRCRKRSEARGLCEDLLRRLASVLEDS
ncbi:MAG: hypothetical protein HY924_09320 [Elusimicrobia bacterium]|nr:hypothetical protein [Elusimicrobiota bacterium]